MTRLTTYLPFCLLLVACGTAGNVAAKPQANQSQELRGDLTELGIEYQLLTLEQPRPNRAHVLRVDLSEKNLQPAVVVALDPDGEGPAEAELTDPLTLASDPRILAFVNTNPWEGIADNAGNHITKWFVGQHVNIVGLAVAEGDARSQVHPRGTSVWFDQQGKIKLAGKRGGGPKQQPREAMAGFQPVATDGTVVVEPGGARHPRTAVGTNAAGTSLWLVVVDGRQPGYSEGMDLHELGTLMLELGCTDATNMDGGGSSIMGLAGSDGKLKVVNRPSGSQAAQPNQPPKYRPVPTLLTIKLRPNSGQPAAAPEDPSP